MVVLGAGAVGEAGAVFRRTLQQKLTHIYSCVQ